MEIIVRRLEKIYMSFYSFHEFFVLHQTYEYLVDKHNLFSCGALFLLFTYHSRRIFNSQLLIRTLNPRIQDYSELVDMLPKINQEKQDFKEICTMIVIKGFYFLVYYPENII